MLNIISYVDNYVFSKRMGSMNEKKPSLHYIKFVVETYRNACYPAKYCT